MGGLALPVQNIGDMGFALSCRVFYVVRFSGCREYVGLFDA
jgi:hypothetical protein